MIREYSAFIQNTIYPMLDNIKDIIDTATEKGLPIDKESLGELLEKIFLAHLIDASIKAFVNIFIAVIVCITAYKILS